MQDVLQLLAEEVFGPSLEGMGALSAPWGRSVRICRIHGVPQRAQGREGWMTATHSAT